eukprot:TRINITY_DN36747_c0_g1_i1.p1 TRINITY_DN36747_c0_g1~~TRINITY_DN36747_c0_g1_i1.p1  ORF type:complete len:380 (+),score=93.08 TRINITY_DN36747_c0_g1_i1:96-1142(+)
MAARNLCTAAGRETEGIVMNAFGGTDVLQRSRRVLPALGPRDVMVEVAAAGVNPVDTYIRKGIYPAKPQLPFTPGLEGSGRVVETGAEVRTVKVGDAVAFTATGTDGGFDNMTGSYAQHCVMKESLTMPVPPHLELASAAALPISYLTAHRALFHVARAKPTDRVLIRGASGAVGLAAVHLARHFGAPDRAVVGTAGNPDAWRERICAWGASTVVGHSHDSVCDLGPFDVIIEHMARLNLESDAKVVAPGGRIVVVGSPPQSDGRSIGAFDCRDIMTREASISGVFLWKQTEEERAAAAKDIFESFAERDTPPPTHQMSLADVAQAHDMVDPAIGRAKDYDGKIILVP